MWKEIVQEQVKEVMDQIMKDRHHLHAHPELSFQEVETAAYIRQQLDDLGVPWETCTDNGTVALVSGKLPSEQVTGLRADIDALPILEENQIPYRSLHDGVMHACGHDVHTSCLLGVIRVLVRLKEKFAGTVKCVFQPAEEKFPGGAAAMVATGALENPRPSFMLAQHVMPELEAGKIGIREGLYAASNDEVYISVLGKGGHGSQPDALIDPVSIAAQLIVSLQQIVSRKANPIIPTVLSFGKIIANGATNIIPDNVYIEGTLRTFDPEWRKEAHQLIEQTAQGIAKALGARCEVKIQGFPNVYNDPAYTKQIREWAIEFLGKENVVDLPLWMAGEDFGEFTVDTPGCYYRTGTGNKQQGITAPLHNACFNVDEKPTLEVGTSLMTFLTLKTLGN